MILQVSTNTKLYDLKKPTHIMNEPSLKETNLAHCKGIPARLRKGKQALMYVTRAWPQIFPPAVPARVHLTL